MFPIQLKIYVLLLIILQILPNECRKMKSHSTNPFSFDSLLSGMNGAEKKMFKEELEKEVKKFHIPSHHKQKSKTNNVRKKSHKLSPVSHPKKKEPVSPGICDPICEHQCVHGCDFRCCIPQYQVTHNIPRPLPHVVLPGSCSPSCSPTCYPECTPTCCAGGPSGMFQSSNDLYTLTCSLGCPATCYPECTPSCCNPMQSVSHYPDIYSPPNVQPQFRRPPQLRPPPPRRPYRPPPPNLLQPVAPVMQASTGMMMQQQPVPQYMPVAPMPDVFTHCGGGCPVSCAPHCLSSCCMESQQQIFSMPGMPIAPMMMAPPPPVCPGTCPSSCAPACDSSCCQPMTLQQMIPMLSPPQTPPMIQQQTKPPPPQSPPQPPAIPEVPSTKPQSQLTCHSSCPDICLPDCTDSCCNPGPTLSDTEPPHSDAAPHTEIDKKSKISKIAAQLAMLRKKHK